MRAYTAVHRSFVIGRQTTWRVVCIPGVLVSDGLGFLFETISTNAVVDDFGNFVAVGEWS